ncbi:hypothetical protein [Trujillonella humicola]|uniref:hypothetical protein n=1 Tax=Trujillonella humicola TaxID=3383699 RepID=UPI003905A15D
MTSVDPQPSPAPTVGTTCTRRTAGHTPHRATILLCHTGALSEWRSVFVLGVHDGVVTLADGDEVVGFANHAPGELARAVAEAGPEAHLNTRFGYLFLASWPRDPEAVFSLAPTDRPHSPCG